MKHLHTFFYQDGHQEEVEVDYPDPPGEPPFLWPHDGRMFRRANIHAPNSDILERVEYHEVGE